MPWYFKIAAKLVLSRLPVAYSLYRRMGVFRNGPMDSADYALNTFQTHFDRAVERGLTIPFCAMEIGPGDSVASGLYAHCVGAQSTFLVDVGPFATQKMPIYEKLAEHAKINGLENVKSLCFEGFDDLLVSINTQYFVEGLKSMRSLPDDSVDFIWSNAVLEHIRVTDFSAFISETQRILKPGGIVSHRVDLRDHLGGRLDNLRFPGKVWEAEFMATSGFYTNRIRFTEMINIFKKVGFNVDVLCLQRWSSLPTSRTVMAEEFCEWPDDELLIRGFDVILTY